MLHGSLNIRRIENSTQLESVYAVFLQTTLSHNSFQKLMFSE
jgi:hypothetical protein